MHLVKKRPRVADDDDDNDYAVVLGGRVVEKVERSKRAFRRRARHMIYEVV